MMRTDPETERPSRLSIESLMRLQRDFAQRPRKRRRKQRRQAGPKNEPVEPGMCEEQN